MAEPGTAAALIDSSLIRRLANTSRSGTLGDNIKIAARRLERGGLSVELLSHKTSMVIERPRGMDWSSFSALLRSALNPRLGSLLLFSETTGRAWICSNRGNRPGEFVRC
jgi:hypothetical protein